MVDRFEDLRTFTAVISCGGINAAAAELGIAKSAVSRRISDLEKRLGVLLIERSTRRFEPTAVGIEYASRAVAILTSLDELDTSLASGVQGGMITVCAPLSLITHRIIPALGATGMALNGLVVRFVSDPSEALACDISIALETPPGRASRELLLTKPVVCASRAYLAKRGVPDNPQRLDGHVAIAIAGRRQPTWRLGQGERRMPVTAISVTDDDAAAAAAVAGLGLVQLSDYVVVKAIADGRLSRVFEKYDPTPTPLIASFAQDADFAIKQFVDLLAHALD